MMLLNDYQIRQLIEEEDVISPYNPELVQPCSIDIRLGNEMAWYDGYDTDIIDPSDKETYNVSKKQIDTNGIILYPYEFILINTLETFKLPRNISARVDGRSSIGRFGIEIHVTAGFIDPGFEGKITLELSNVNRRPVKLVPGMVIGQVSFTSILPCGKDYGEKGGRYMGDMGVQASLYWK